jgi:hypothetical protein
MFPKPVFIVVCFYYLDHAVDCMHLKDVKDILINFFFFFFFFYSGSFINIYYLNFYLLLFQRFQL